MPLQLDMLTRRLRPHLSSHSGLIGVDVGTRVIKVAQVERYRSSWRLAGIRVLPLADNRELSCAAIEDGVIGESLEGFSREAEKFTGRDAACLLPTAIAEPECQMLPQSDELELRSMVEADASGPGGGASVVDMWSDEGTWDTDLPTARVSTYSLPEGVARQCAEDMLSQGLHCQYMDGLPFALSRAVQLVDSDAELETVAALDWGHSRPLLTILRNGVPAFTRVLRTCGTMHLEAAMQQALEVTPHESARLLSLAPVAGTEGESRLSESLSRLVGPQLDRMVEQLRRTVTFLGQQHPELVPARLWMLGGGATLQGIDQYVAQRLEIETNVWQLPAWQLAPSLRRLRQQPLFGAAVGLSVPV